VHQQLKAPLEAAAAQQAESCAQSAGEPEHHLHMVRIHLLLSNRDKGRESRPQHRRSGVDSSLTVTPGTPSRLDDEPRASTTTATTTRATTTSGHRRRHDSDDDCERSWSPKQRGPRAFGRSIRDANFPSRFRAPTNVPIYDGDTNPSVWLEDY
jgi:hypothetical protein